MSGSLVRRGRWAVAGFGLILVSLLIWVGEASGARYAVAQCGWHVGSEAAWGDTTGGAKFRPSSHCVPPAGADPFDGVHLKSFTREGEPTVSGTRFARWRWTTPPGTGIVNVRGTWWHALHDGFEHRLGTDSGDGGFAPFAWTGATDVSMKDFAAGFWPPQWAFESRLLCAKGEAKWCEAANSWSGVRALTLTIEDLGAPTGSIGGQITDPVWLRGNQSVLVAGTDIGGGMRFSETYVDGSRVALHEYPCSKAMIGGEWRATRMLPCSNTVWAEQIVATTGLSDGPHQLAHCLTDFAGNGGCFGQRTIRIDNNAPAHPRSAGLAGGEGWRRVNDFDVRWANPDQGVASPIDAARWRISGPAGYDGGAQLLHGRDISAISDRRVPGPGVYTLRLWLGDHAGNDNPASAVEIPLRFDDVAPGVAYSNEMGPDFPEAVSAEVADAHSGPAAGDIRYRRLGSDTWTDLPTKLERGAAADRARIVARLPGSLAAGTYLFRAEVADGAGNVAMTTRRADGTELAIRKPAPPAPESAAAAGGGERSQKAGPRRKSRIFARLRWSKRMGSSVTVPYGAGAILRGRLLDAEGAGLSGRRLRVVSRPSRGALVRRSVWKVETGRQGGFRLVLPDGPSRRVSVVFRGDDDFEPSMRAPLSMRVRSGVRLGASPLSLRTGEELAFHGRVLTKGAPLPRRGKLIAIQYLEAETRRWRPVLVTRTDHSGNFRARYRFRYVVGMARVRMRAVALPEERWPYAPGGSPAVLVRVRG